MGRQQQQQQDSVLSASELVSNSKSEEEIMLSAQTKAREYTNFSDLQVTADLTKMASKIDSVPEQIQHEIQHFMEEPSSSKEDEVILSAKVNTDFTP